MTGKGQQARGVSQASEGSSGHQARLSSKAGLPPGSLVYIGPDRDHRVNLVAIPVGAVDPTPQSLTRVEQLQDLPQGGRYHWLILDGLHEQSWMEALGRQLDIGPLVLEDVLNTRQRPKFEVHPGMLLFQLKSIRRDGSRLGLEQVSLLVGPDWVLTVLERPSALLDPVFQRLQRPSGRLRQGGPDLLAAAVLDVIVDGCFEGVENLGEQLEHLEQRVHKEVDGRVMPDAYRMRSRLHELRRAFLPLRDALNQALQQEPDRVQPTTRPYLRDVLDHTLHLIDQVETQREIVNQVVELHLALVNLRSTEVMKVLTIIATLFIPLSFLAGVYGMNFDRGAGPLAMPELSWAWGYPAFWGLCLLFAGGFLVWFRRKRWI